MYKRFRSLNRHKNGQAVLMVTFALIPMIGFVGLVTDLGYMYHLKIAAQTAADAAALAGAYRFDKTISGSEFTCDQYAWICKTNWQCPSDLTVATNPAETACLYAKTNGFSTSNPKVNVTVTSNVTDTISDVSGVDGLGYWLRVKITQNVPQLFSAVMGNTTGTVAAQSTSGLHPGLGCVYALDPSTSGSFYQNGNTNFTSACGIYVNSSSATAMLGNGGSVLQTSTINIVGGYDYQGTISPTPNTGISPFLDPLAYLEPPAPCSSAGGCNSANCSAHPNRLTINSDVRLYPGTYCGGIRVKNATVTFDPGQYIIVGGGLSTQDSNSHVRGTDVFFYNTYNTSNAYSEFDFNANSDVQIAAPTSGPYAAVLAFQDRNCCSTAPANLKTESFQGGATSWFEGIIYFPKSLVQFRGNPSLDIAHYTIVVAWQFAVQGTSTMNNDYSHLVGGNPIKTVGLIQ